MSNKTLLIAIVVGLIVLCAIVAYIAYKVVDVMQASEMSQDLMFYCTTTGHSAGECGPWITDILNSHRAEVSACVSDAGVSAECIEDLGLQP
jgi:hypothetical protein